MNVDRKSIVYFVVFCILISGFAAYHLRITYLQEEDKARERVSSSGYLIAEWIKGAFEITDYLLKDILGHVREGDLVYPHPDKREQQHLTEVIVSKMNSVPNVILAGLFDENCIITHVNNNEVGWDGSQRDYCTNLRDNPDRQTFVSNAFVSTAGPLNVTQSRKYRPNEPGFHGFAAVGVNLDFFSKWIEKLSLGPHGVIAISDQNISLLARKPARPDKIGKTVSDPVVEEFLTSGATDRIYRGVSPLDGELRLFAVRKVEGLPFIVVIGEADQDWLASWRQRVWLVAVAVAILWSLAFITFRYYRRHLQSLAELKVVNKALAELSVTDALTGLANRRRFNEVLDIEFRRMCRSKKSLSILMVDIDFFKILNDTYGHLEGDECLRTVGKVIANTVQRPQDLAARYGGEEFSCILPETDLDGAVDLAEKIRANIEAMNYRNEGSRVADHVTVSIGVATFICDQQRDRDTNLTPQHIVSRADECLYWAKENGRNRVGYDGVDVKLK